MNRLRATRKSIRRKADSMRSQMTQVCREFKQKSIFFVRANALPSCGVFAAKQNGLDVAWERTEARKICRDQQFSQHRFDVELLNHSQKLPGEIS
jgi:hypothetical protein